MRSQGLKLGDEKLKMGDLDDHDVKKQLEHHCPLRAQIAEVISN